MDASYSSGGAFGTVALIITVLLYLILMLFCIIASVLVVIAEWKLFAKAGRKGWEGIIPIYNIWVMAKVLTTNNVLWFILALVPFANFVSVAIMLYAMVKGFGKNVGYLIFTVLFPYVALPILAFGKSEYNGFTISF